MKMKEKDRKLIIIVKIMQGLNLYFSEDQMNRLKAFKIFRAITRQLLLASRTKNKNEKRTAKNRQCHMTNLYLSVPKNLKKFLIEFREILKNNYSKITIKGEKQYTCG